MSKQWIDVNDIDGEKFIQGLDELEKRALKNLRCMCGAPTDAFDNCLGTCAGEEWE